MRIRFEGRHFSKCACSERKTPTHSRPRPPIYRSLLAILRLDFEYEFSFLRTHLKKKLNDIKKKTGSGAKQKAILLGPP